jgi:hypothetical protein
VKNSSATILAEMTKVNVLTETSLQPKKCAIYERYSAKFENTLRMQQSAAELDCGTALRYHSRLCGRSFSILDP